jgi:hypothetical protein
MTNAVADRFALAELSRRLYRQLTAFGQIASCSAAANAAWRAFRPHAEIATDWLGFSGTELPAWARDEPYVLPFDSPSAAPRAGRAEEGDFGAGLLATMQLSRLDRRFGRHADAVVRHRAWLAKAGLYVFAASGFEGALGWLVSMNAAGLVPHPLHLSQTFAALIEATSGRLALPPVDDRPAWAALDVDRVVDLGPADGDLPLFVTNSGADQPSFKVGEQLILLQTVAARVEQIRAAVSLDEWVLGETEAGVLVNAALRLFPAPAHRARLALVVRFVLDELDELSADFGPGGSGVASSDEPDWRQNWDHARYLVAAAEREHPSHGRDQITARRLVLPRAVANDVATESDLPWQWRLMSPDLALVWGTHREWDSRYGDPRDYVRPLPPRPELTAAAASRLALKAKVVPDIARLIQTAAAAKHIDQARQALSIAIVDSPFSDELLAAAAYVESAADRHQAACQLAVTALAARPAQVQRWYDLARILVRGGAEDAARTVFMFIRVHRDEEVDVASSH